MLYYFVVDSYPPNIFLVINNELMVFGGNEINEQPRPATFLERDVNYFINSPVE